MNRVARRLAGTCTSVAAALGEPGYAVALSGLTAGALVAWFAAAWWHGESILSLLVLVVVATLLLTAACWSIGHAAIVLAKRRRIVLRALLPLAITLCAPIAIVVFLVHWLTLGHHLDFMLRRDAFREVGQRVEALATGNGTLGDRVSTLPSDLPRIGRERGGLAIAHRPHGVTALFRVHGGGVLIRWTAFVYSSDDTLTALDQLGAPPCVSTPMGEHWFFLAEVDD